MLSTLSPFEIPAAAAARERKQEMNSVGGPIDRSWEFWMDGIEAEDKDSIAVKKRVRKEVWRRQEQLAAAHGYLRTAAAAAAFSLCSLNSQLLEIYNSRRAAG